MKHNGGPAQTPTFLGIECGGTRSVALLVDAAGNAVRRTQAGPANLRLLSDSQLVRHFRAIKARVALPSAIAIGMAGARTETDRQRIRRAAAAVWPGVSCHATNDLETVLMAAEAKAEGRRQKVEMDDRATHAERSTIGKSRLAIPRVLVLSGTGSCCFGRANEGKTAKVGGWGHILGDKGSGYEIGLRALKATVYYYDQEGVWSGLGQRILRALLLNEPDDLIGWVQNAGKTDIAALAVEVFAAARQRDKIARDILEAAAHSLARDAAACARRLAKPGTSIQFVFSGSVLLKQPRFAHEVAKQLHSLWPQAVITPLKRESVWGAVELARQLGLKFKVQSSKFKVHPQPDGGEQELVPLQSLSLSPTEQRNARSMHLDKLPLRDAIALMLSEDAKIPAAILRERKNIERAIQLIVRSFRRGGRLFYVGAGTSGRLGVLDASECPPTFRADQEMVQGLIAGGQRALWEAVEGAEDDPAAGARAVKFRGVIARDTVVGIAASGRTPFVWGALNEAKRRGAATIFLSFNSNLKIPRDKRPSLAITPNVGPEVLTGSTRLKAGTATKLILNIFTTLAMVRLGKVLSNLMVDVKASNTKLRDRATRIVQDLTGADYTTARAALEKANWKIKPACARLKPKGTRTSRTAPSD